MKTSELIFPFTHIINRKQKENLLKQRAKAFWLTGLSCSGKTSIAEHVASRLFERNFLVQVLDGDMLREGINKDLTFSQEDRAENIRRVAEISRLFVQGGIITLNCFITPSESLRKTARQIIGVEDYVEIFIDAPVEACERRDSKGLYRKARSGEVSNLPGINAVFEPPVNPHLVLNTAISDVHNCAEKLLHFLLPLITVIR